jgi:DNA-binding CsgD family transcriptional regulator
MHHPAWREDDSAIACFDRDENAPPPERAAAIDVLWCHDTNLPGAPLRHNQHLGIAAALAGAHNAAERSRMVSGMLRLIGFSTFAYFALEMTRERVDRLLLHEAFVPAAYRGDYVRQRYHEIDPRTLGARRANLPIVWDLQQLRKESDGAARASANGNGIEGFLATMSDDGMRSGLMFAMAIPSTRLHAFMSFTAPQRSRDWMTSTTVEQALSLGVSVHAFASPQLAAAANARPIDGLNPFERELLIGIAEGASDKEIGRRLDTTAYNVDYHLRKLRKRFGVANRIELTYLASRLELI